MKLRCIVSILLPMLALRMAAAPLDCIFEHYSSEDGLSHNYISQILQDRQGYIWISTWYGLNRFDGNRFVNYTVQPGDYSNLSHNRILSLSEDANGYLWVTTYDNSIYRFDSLNEKFISVPGDITPELSKARVEKYHCDRSGNTWIALSGIGLYRVDKNLDSRLFIGASDNIIGKEIRHIYEDSDGAVYIVSECGVASVKDDIPAVISRNAGVDGFAEFGNKIIFISGNEILAIDKTSGLREHCTVGNGSTGPAVSVTVTGPSDGGRLYVAFRKGAIASVDTTDFSAKIHWGGVALGRVRYTFPDPEGLLWIVTDKTGITSWDEKAGRFRHYEHSRNVMSYYADTLARVVNRDGRLWIKMNRYGFGYYDRDADAIIPLNNVKEQQDCRFMNGVACYMVDNSGVLWFSTVGRGLERATVITPRVEIVDPPSESDEEVSAAEVRALLTDSRGQVWVATKSRELFVYSPDMSSCRKIRGSDTYGVIYSIFEDSEGDIWIGTKGDGVVKLGRRGNGSYAVEGRYRHCCSDPFSLSSDDVYSISQDHSGRMWVGTYGGGLSMLPHPDSTSFRNVYMHFPDYPLETGEKVRYVHCMPDGRMLVATVGGLIWFWPDDSPELITFHTVRKIPGDMHSLGNNDIIYIFTDRGGDTWLCTFGGGLNRIAFDGDEVSFDIVSKADGLNSNIVLSAIDDDRGNIWLATETGISKVSVPDRSVVNYSRYYGIVPTTFSEAACSRLEDGTIVFGTLNNVYHIDPDKFIYEPQNKHTVISGVTVDGRRMPLTGRQVIPHDYSFFSIDFASLNFRIQGNVRYTYRLKGYNKNWIAADGNTSVSYSRIPAGNYTFMVSASTEDGYSDPQTVCLDLRVKPHPWASWWAIALYVLAALAVILALVRMFVTSVKLKNDVALQESLNDIKGRFFTNISHELRTPLTLILGGIEDIRSKMSPDSPDEYSVNLVYKNSKRMMTLVNQLLDIRRIVKGKMKLNVSRIDIVQLVKQVYDDFKDMSIERHIEMRLTHSVDSLVMWGDSVRIEALIYNLISNAFKYTADGGRIEVAVYWKDGEQDCTVMVKDNGIGVPKEKQTAIFEPFISTSDTPFNGVASSGIGLSFCKEIVDVHGGRIWVESEKGHGSKFFIRLPLGKEHFSPENTTISEETATEEKSESYGLSKYKVSPTHPDDALKVMIVEDNAELKIYIYNSLINKYDVRDASNGVEALSIIDQGWMPDIIVTDLMMPQMDGISLVNHIRGDFNTSHIPIIMITAKHEDDTHLKAMKYGVDGYISKPFTMELLAARIENLMERRRTLLSRFAENGNAGKKGSKVDIQPDEIVITDRDEVLIKKVMNWLEEYVSDAEVTVDQLAAHVGMGRTSMYNKIKGLTGKSPVELIQDYRLEKATYYLKSGQYSVSETCYKVGFSDPGYFSRSFKKHFGMSPVDYIKEHKTEKQ